MILARNTRNPSAKNTPDAKPKKKHPPTMDDNPSPLLNKRTAWRTLLRAPVPASSSFPGPAAHYTARVCVSIFNIRESRAPTNYYSLRQIGIHAGPRARAKMIRAWRAWCRIRARLLLRGPRARVPLAFVMRAYVCIWRRSFFCN